MTLLRIIPEADSFSRAERELDRLAGQTSNLPGALKNVGEALLKTTRERFRTKTAPDGSSWTPHAPLSLRLGAKPGNMLRRSGRLFRSVNYQVGGSILRVGANAPPYDRAQQFGAVIKPKKGKFPRVPVFERVEIGRHINNVTAMCSQPRPVDPVALRAALEFEFDLPYPNGRMGLVPEALTAFSDRLQVSL